MLDLSHKALHVIPQRDQFHLLQYHAGTRIPESIFTNPAYSFASIIKTPDEVSVVISCRSQEKLTGLEELGEAQESDGPWLALRVRGPMELTMTGVMNELTKPFVEASIPVFALSSWNTDYLLIPWTKQEKGLETLKSGGWTIAETA